MEIGQPIIESDTVFLTWSGIKNTNSYYDSNEGLYGLVQDGIVIAARLTLSEVAKLYIEITWGNPGDMPYKVNEI